MIKIYDIIMNNNLSAKHHNNNKITITKKTKHHSKIKITVKKSKSWYSLISDLVLQINGTSSVQHLVGLQRFKLETLND